jgi:L-aminopeptidase/D-esterase-like protein
LAIAAGLACGVAASATTQSPVARARDLGVPFTGTPGPANAITDVAGVEVGQVTLIRGKGKLRPGHGPVRTGVTTVLPRGKTAPRDPVFAGWFALNGNGEMTGTTWVQESGQLWGPIVLTNTHSVGTARDAVIRWARARFDLDVEDDAWSLPVVAETWDGWLNDIWGFHVRPEHVSQALDDASGGAVAEGNVGGGTGMICYGFKCGIGTASRWIFDDAGDYTLGVLVQANFGRREQLMIAGIPVGRRITEHPAYADRAAAGYPLGGGSIIVVIATDAPLLPHQLQRIARRASLGIARTGATADDSSGDIFIAFSTANRGAGADTGTAALTMLPNARLTRLFDATVEATEEAIVNALVAAQSMRGVNDRYAWALPHDRLTQLIRQAGNTVAAPVLDRTPQ